MFPKSVKLEPEMAWVLGAFVAVALVWVFSAFFQTSFIGVIPPNTTLFLRFEAGTVNLGYYGCPVYLASTVACSHTHQDFTWSEFFFVHVPVDPAGVFSAHSEVWFPIWVLLLPVLACALLAIGRAPPNRGWR